MKLALTSCLVVVWSACGSPATPVAQPVSNAPPAARTGSAGAGAGSSGSGSGSGAADVADAPPAAHPRGAPILAWPVAPFTAVQIAEVTACDADKLAEKRYPTSVAIDALATAYPPANACDQAALAVACASRAPDAPPASCLAAYRAAVTANPALALVGSIPEHYFDHAVLVAPPPVASRTLASAVLDYHWDGLGKGVAWRLEIRDAATTPTAALTGATAAGGKGDLRAAVGELAAGLDGFLPIVKPIEAVACYDNYPDWTVTLTYDNGDRLVVETHKSNLLGIGGPWQATIKGTTYLQLSPSLAQAVGAIVRATGAPLGEPEAMSCHGYDLPGAMLGRP